jgi:hypothetical protein|nr:MAG TPA: hypothetical protein [Caudoviricetes sp.]
MSEYLTLNVVTNRATIELDKRNHQLKDDLFLLLDNLSFSANHYKQVFKIEKEEKEYVIYELLNNYPGIVLSRVSLSVSEEENSFIVYLKCKVITNKNNHKNNYAYSSCYLAYMHLLNYINSQYATAKITMDDNFFVTLTGNKETEGYFALDELGEKVAYTYLLQEQRKKIEEHIKEDYFNENEVDNPFGYNQFKAEVDKDFTESMSFKESGMVNVLFITSLYPAIDYEIKEDNIEMMRLTTNYLDIPGYILYTSKNIPFIAKLAEKYGFMDLKQYFSNKC